MSPSVPVTVVVVCLSVLCLSVLGYGVSSWLSPSWKCLPAPFLYLTFHENRDIRKYSRDGCFLSDSVLEGKRGSHRKERKREGQVKEARGLQIGQYEGEEALYVIQAQSSSSGVKIYGKCEHNGKRRFVANGPSILTVTGLDHPYSLAFGPDGSLYVSCQHSNSVFRFSKNSFFPLPLPPALNSTAGLLPGTFYQYPTSTTKRRKHHHHSPPVTKVREGVRGLIFVGDNLWIACEDIRGVSVVSPEGDEIHRVLVRRGLKPVGLLYDQNITGLVLVSTKGKKQGPVLGINPVTRQVEKEFLIEGQVHSTGMVMHEETLFVACQELGAVLSYHLPTSRFLGVVASGFPDTVEQIELSAC